MTTRIITDSLTAAQQDIQRLSALVRAQQITIDKLEAQRQWVGLTARDWNVIGFTAEFRAGAEWANDKLKEKNT